MFSSPNRRQRPRSLGRYMRTPNATLSDSTATTASSKFDLETAILREGPLTQPFVLCFILCLLAVWVLTGMITLVQPFLVLHPRKVERCEIEGYFHGGGGAGLAESTSFSSLNLECSNGF